jgi:hypothetical protein
MQRRHYSALLGICTLLLSILIISRLPVGATVTFVREGSSHGMKGAINLTGEGTREIAVRIIPCSPDYL